MSSEVWQGIRDTVAPVRGAKDGPLPPLLLAMTVVTGLVDAFSYLELGRVFVANMTGNAVFLAFDLGGAAGFVWWALLTAVAAFLIGAYVGGRLVHHATHRGQHLFLATLTQAVLTAAAFVVALVMSEPYRNVAVAVLVILLGLAMGLQNATARGLGVLDLTTTVLTLTMTGIAADSRAAGGTGSRIGRRGLSIGAMFLGGLIGAVLVVNGNGAWVLLIATVLLVGVGLAAYGFRNSIEPWTETKKK